MEPEQGKGPRRNRISYDDSMGILRVGGRLRQANLSFDLRSPCTVFSQSLSVNSLRWRIGGERAGNAKTKIECACVRCFLKFKMLSML